MFTAARFNLKQLANLCRRTGTSLDAGVDLRKTLRRETESLQGRNKQTLSEVAERVNAGDTLSDSMKNTGEAFPPLMHDLVSVGEQTGRLDMVLLRLADHYEGMQRLRGIFLAGIAWPMIQLFAAIGVIGLLILIMGMIPSNSEGFSVTPFGLKGTSGLITYLISVGAIIGGIAFLIVNWTRGKLGAEFAWPVIDRIPMLGNCLRTMALSRVAWTLSLTNDTPMDAMNAMDASLRASGSPIFSRLQKPVRHSLMEGKSMHEALKETGAFPHEFLDTVAVGEETGRVSESLLKLSEQYETRASTAAKTLTVFGSMVVWGMVAMIIIYFIFKIAMSYIGMIEQMTDPGFMR